MSHRSLLVAVAALTASLPLRPADAQAPSRPFVVPQQDVDVLYAVPMPASGPAQAPIAAAAQRMRFSVAPARQRVDPPGPGTYMITNYDLGQLIVVQPSQRIATLLPAPGGPIAPHGTRAVGDYRQQGTRTVAGLACTDWATRDASGTDSVVCLTADGVMLRAMQGGQVLVQAVRVAYGRQDPSLFAVPDGYRSQTPATTR